MKKEITIAQFADELKSRLNSGQTVDCCKMELLNLADIVKDKIGSERITVDWKD
jgi:chromosomal replication initiation ATPase DnaA